MNSIPEGYMWENGHLVMTDEKMDEVFRYATEQAKLGRQSEVLPTTEWDAELQKAYILYPDGRREYDLDKL